MLYLAVWPCLRFNPQQSPNSSIPSKAPASEPKSEPGLSPRNQAFYILSRAAARPSVIHNST